MDWTKVVNVPKYNPMMFTLARNLSGLARWELAKKCGFTTKKLADIEAGNIEATDEDVAIVTKISGHVVKAFFMQWHETEIEWKSYGGIPKQIDYYKFKIFRDANPPLLRIA